MYHWVLWYICGRFPREGCKTKLETTFELSFVGGEEGSVRLRARRAPPREPACAREDGRRRGSGSGGILQKGCGDDPGEVDEEALYAEALREQARLLGIDPDSEPHLLRVAEMALLSPPPKGWSKPTLQMEGPTLFATTEAGKQRGTIQNLRNSKLTSLRLGTSMLTISRIT